VLTHCTPFWRVLVVVLVFGSGSFPASYGCIEGGCCKGEGETVAREGLDRTVAVEGKKEGGELELEGGIKRRF